MMSRNLRILLIIGAVLLIITILKLLSKEKLPVTYSLCWISAAFIILLVGAFPEFVKIITDFIGFETTSNLVIGIMGVIILLITLVLTIIVYEQKKKITLLVQEVSIIKANQEKK